MMFLCKECGKKYRINPNYCDCGNDSFDKISKMPDKSVLFLTACIILSFIILLIPVNITSSKNPETNQPKKTESAAKIPDINTFWNNKLPSVKIEVSVHQQQTAPRIVVKQPQQPQKQNVKVPQKSHKSQKSKQAQTQTKPQQKTIKKAKAVAQSKPVQKVPPTPVKKVQTKKTSNTSAKSAAEVYRYKLGLRQALFANLSVASVQGRGKCGIEFSIDKNGKLINRSFTFQSDNRSINDEVYKMLMKMPKYYAPPKAYTGEKIKMTFEFNNGSFIINYVN